MPSSSGQINKTSNVLGVPIEQVQAKATASQWPKLGTLTALVPGAVDTGGSNQRSVRFAGRGRDDNNWTYDGIDATNIINQPQQPYVRLAIPLDTIQEFRVDSHAVHRRGGSHRRRTVGRNLDLPARINSTATASNSSAITSSMPRTGSC